MNSFFSQQDPKRGNWNSENSGQKTYKTQTANPKPRKGPTKTSLRPFWPRSAQKMFPCLYFHCSYSAPDGAPTCSHFLFSSAAAYCVPLLVVWPAPLAHQSNNYCTRLLKTLTWFIDDLIWTFNGASCRVYVKRCLDRMNITGTRGLLG